MEQAQISKVRASVHQQCGNRVKIQLDRGRNKVVIIQLHRHHYEGYSYEALLIYWNIFPLFRISISI